MKIKQFELVDRCLFWKKEKILVVGDLHLGYEEVLLEEGVSFPMTQMEITFDLFERIFRETGKLNKIILLGDVKHLFGGILRGERSDFFNLMEMFKKNLYSSGKIIVTKGNHDKILEPIVRNYDFVKLVEKYFEKGVLFFHGEKNQWEEFQIDIFDKKTKLLVTGHFHPAVRISEDGKSEKYKCFALGKYKKKDWLIVPSFFPLEEGTELGWLVGERNFSRSYKTKNFKIWVLSGVFGEILKFGKFKK